MAMNRREFLTFMGATGISANAFAAWKFWDRRSGPFVFATIGDTHIKDASSTAIVNRAIKSINANEDIKLVIMLGDLATDGTNVELKLAKASFDRLDKPLLVLPGNHDVDLTSEDIYRNYRTQFEDTHWHESEDGVALLGIDSCNGTASDVTIRADQLEWLEARIKKTKKDTPLLVFAHHPFNPNSKAYRVQNADEVLGLFSEHNVRLVATGHYHGNQEETRDDVLFTTTACCSSTRDNHDGTSAKGYRLFTLDKDALSTEFVAVQP